MKSIAPLLALTLTTLIWSNSSAAFDTADDKTTAQSSEGFVRVDDSQMDIVYAKENINWHKYDSLFFAPVATDNEHPEGYKPPKIRPGTDGMSASYDLREKDLARLADEYTAMVARVFNDEQPWKIVTEPSPTTLVIAAKITDIRLAAPREDSRKTGRQSFSRSYTQNSGSMVLIAQLQDSISGEILAQVADRGTTINQWKRNTSVFNWGDVKTILRNWINTMKNGLIQLHENDE